MIAHSTLLNNTILFNTFQIILFKLHTVYSFINLSNADSVNTIDIFLSIMGLLVCAGSYLVTTTKSTALCKHQLGFRVRHY